MLAYAYGISMDMRNSMVVLYGLWGRCCKNIGTACSVNYVAK